MCGIAGFFGIGDQADIRRMTDALAHRGPDGGGVFLDGRLALGHRRLSIIDVRDGAQPMTNPASGAVIVYNGEIYNHLPIRGELEDRGHVFHTGHSDTETLLHAFEEWGPACLSRLNGMFAFALYQPAKQLLWLARDRFGEKPLFYTANENGFAFASEIASLRLWPGFENTCDKGNLQRFFAWNYLPGVRTIHKNCQSLAPASWLCLDLRDLRQEKGAYWQFALQPDNSLTDDEELAEELRRLLVQAVRRRFLSDVPLGIFLSGGIDSSAVLAAACKVADPESISTFTIGFHEKSFDESDKARQVADYLGVRNQVEYLSEKAMRASIGAILGQMSEPFGDASLIPTYHLAAFARRHVTVALSGDGGDELFGGYDPMAAIRPAAIYRRLVPSWLHRLARKAVSGLRASDRNMSLEFKVKRMLRGLSWPESIQLPIWMSGLEPYEIAEFFEKPLDARALYGDAERLFAANPDLDGLEQALMFFTCLYLPCDILVKSDRASMMVSLESRAVFLDNDLVDFCARLPMRCKYRPGQRKYLLKKALAGWLPKNILEQPKKGFGIPLNLWLRSLPPADAAIPGLKPWVIRKCSEIHAKRHGDFRYFLWDAQVLSRMAGGI